MHELELLPTFIKAYKKLLKRDPAIRNRVQKALLFLQQDPQHPSLKSHKVNTRNYGPKWSSWVTGDVRLIWDFDEDNRVVILVLDIGGHSGGKKVYK